MSTLMQIDGVGKSFGGLKAVQNVSLSVTEGRLSALIGPNGAGKTTLFALMSGFLKPDTGRVVFAGQDITGQAPHLNARMGLTRTFQIVRRRRCARTSPWVRTCTCRAAPKRWRLPSRWQAKWA
jgi:branched-chain amino acid transport system ATP-binding protein